MNNSRRNLCISAVTGLGALICGAAIDAQASANTGSKKRVITIQARKFSYTPSQILLKKDEPVVLEFTSVDFVHGFNIPDLNVRADLVPGQITKVHVLFEKAGQYAFLCDNFCGSGHENMSGKIIVQT